MFIVLRFGILDHGRIVAYVWTGVSTNILPFYNLQRIVVGDSTLNDQAHCMRPREDIR